MAQRKMYEVRAKKRMYVPNEEIMVTPCSTMVAAKKVAYEYARKDLWKYVWILEYIADPYGIFRLSDHGPFMIKNSKED